MSNRQQRRAAKKGKRIGETYADVLARKENLANGIYFPEDDPDKW